MYDEKVHKGNKIDIPSKTREISTQTDDDLLFPLIESKNKNKNNYDVIILTKYIPIIFLMIISFYIYKKSLKGCNLEENQCLEAQNIKKFYKYGYKVLLCSFIIGYIFLLIFKNLISFHIQIPFIAVYIFYFYNYQGADLHNHGLYNSIFLCIFTFFSFIIYFYIYIVLKQLFTKQIHLFLFSISIVLTPVTLLYYLLIKIECDNFYTGLGNLKISQNVSENFCYFPKPKFCTIKLFDNWFDLSKITYLIKKGIPPVPYFSSQFYNSENYCRNKDNSKKVFYEHVGKKKNNMEKYSFDFAYPDTTLFNFQNDARVGKFHYKVFNRIYDYNKRKNPRYRLKKHKKQANPEVVVHFNNETDEGYITMNFRKNNSLIFHRRKEAQKYKVRYDNILFIFIDAVSRNHFKRKFPLTSKLISRYLPNKNINNKNIKIDSYQFLKYNNFRPSTQVNIIPMFYGDSMKSQKGTSLIKYFKEKGYITGGSENICHKELFLLENENNKDVVFESFDHENYAMFCDPNYNPPNNRVSLFKGLFSMMRRCLYNKDTFEYVFEFGYKFLENYKNERKFLRLGFIDGHEGTLEVIKYLDKHLYRFLDFYIKHYFTDSTAIFIASDHGENMLSVHHILNADEFLYERTLGTFFLLLPRYYKQPKNVSLEDLDIGKLKYSKSEKKKKSEDSEDSEDSDYLDDEEMEILDSDDDDDEDKSWSFTNFARNFRGYDSEFKYYHVNNYKDDLFSTLNYNKKTENKKLKFEQKYNPLTNSLKDLQVYKDLNEFNLKYYLNNGENNQFNDDYSYDNEKIIYDDKDFYNCYNKTALLINQQRFITPYDIHDTMVYFVANDYIWRSKKGQSLTKEIDGTKRKCDKYIDDFDNATMSEYCHCINFQ